MKIKQIEGPLACPACSAWLNFPVLHHYNSCGMERYLETGETKRIDEQIQLLLSRHAVLREIGPGGAGGSPW